MLGAPMIPPPNDDDDDDVAWALQTAAVQWNRGAHADAVVWLRRAVDAAITAGNPQRTRELNQLATEVSERMVEGASPGTGFESAPPALEEGDEVDALMSGGPEEPAAPRYRGSQHTLSAQIPIDVDSDDELDDDEAPTIPPAASQTADTDPFSPRRHSVSSIPIGEDDLEPDGAASFSHALVDPSYDELDESEDTHPTPFEEVAMSVRAEELEPSMPPPAVYEPAGAPSPGESHPSDEAAGSVNPLASTLVSNASPSVRAAVTRAQDREEAARSGPMPGPRASLRENRGPVDPLAQTIPGDGDPAPRVESPIAPVSSDTPTLPEDTEAPKSGAEDELTPRPVLEGIGLDGVKGFEDLPEDAQLGLVQSAKLETLAVDEEVGSFAAALVLRGVVGIMPAIADVPGGVARAGDVVFTQGTLDDGIVLRVVALEDDTLVASWGAAALDAAMADCPWVADELRLVADRFQALGGATLGPLGERLDDSLRGIVTDRLEVKYVAPGEIIVEAGKVVPGLHVVGGGRVELLEGDRVVEEVAPGDFLFAAEVMAAGLAHATARAGESGALVLFAPRSVAHDLMVSVPPLLEVLAG